MTVYMKPDQVVEQLVEAYRHYDLVDYEHGGMFDYFAFGDFVAELLKYEGYLD